MRDFEHILEKQIYTSLSLEFQKNSVINLLRYFFDYIARACVINKLRTFTACLIFIFPRCFKRNSKRFTCFASRRPGTFLEVQVPPEDNDFLSLTI
jgi:hypothetical protein